MKTVQFRHSVRQLHNAHTHGMVNAIAALNLKEINAIALYDAKTLGAIAFSIIKAVKAIAP